MRDDQQRALSSYIGEKHSEWAGRAAGHPWDATLLANDLGADARFAALGICGLWNGPTTSEVREILLPIAGPYGWGPPIEVIADAVTLARGRCRSERQRALALNGLGAAGVGAILLRIGRGNG